MKKLLFLLLLFPLSSFADWQFIKKTSYGDVYWDNTNVQKNNNDEYMISILQCN